MRANGQSETDIKALLYEHIGQQINLTVYCQTSTYRRFDDGNRRWPFFGLNHSEHSLRGVMDPCHGLHPWVAGKSVLEV